jgi:hypothetical protein
MVVQVRLKEIYLEKFGALFELQNYPLLQVRPIQDKSQEYMEETPHIDEISICNGEMQYVHNPPFIQPGEVRGVV